ncbi:hypothetical protein ANANG_G00152970 [Anguilla anguilla]|uniref:Uncharacterized protein n=1 Tax=Anguilla anguilla TaxID=7936 RepID=A0A9D3RU63_ANGAN|nr:hypothetical protein ANANG_G00152970 [Anguilla anguilla]
MSYVRKRLEEFFEPSTIPASTVWNCSILTKRREKGEKTTGWDLNNSHKQALSIRIEKRGVCDAVDKLRGEANWRLEGGYTATKGTETGGDGQTGARAGLD